MFREWKLPFPRILEPLSHYMFYGDVSYYFWTEFTEIAHTTILFLKAMYKLSLPCLRTGVFCWGSKNRPYVGLIFGKFLSSKWPWMICKNFSKLFLNISQRKASAYKEIIFLFSSFATLHETRRVEKKRPSQVAHPRTPSCRDNPFPLGSNKPNIKNEGQK